MSSEAAAPPVYAAEMLGAMAVQLLRRAGLPPDKASAVAEILIEGDRLCVRPSAERRSSAADNLSFAGNDYAADIGIGGAAPARALAQPNGFSHEP